MRALAAGNREKVRVLQTMGSVCSTLAVAAGHGPVSD